MNLPILNFVSFLGIFGLCFVAWIFSENRSPRVFPWRVVLMGILLQLILGALVFVVPGTREGLMLFSNLLNVIFDAADAGARFVFGANIVPRPGIEPAVNLGYIFAFRALPTVIFFSGLMALLYNIGVIQVITNVFAKIFYRFMRLSGAESLSGAANIFVGIEAAIVVKPYLARMTRSELCAILACCFGTAASSTLAIYVSFLKPVFPNILGHLVSASIMGIPACFVISKILVPETTVPVTAGGIPQEERRTKAKPGTLAREEVIVDEPGVRSVNVPLEPTSEQDALGRSLQELLPDAEIELDDGTHTSLATAPHETRTFDSGMDMTTPATIRRPATTTAALDERPQETVAGEPMERMSPMDAAIVGALDGVKMAVSIAAVLILILGFVYLINQIFAGLAALPVIGPVFQVLTLQNILGALFLPFTFLTGVSLDWQELWQSSVIIGRRLFETAIPPYETLGASAAKGLLSDRAVVIISYALSGFAHLASVGIFVGGTTALIPSRRKDITELGWKALFVGTLATLMIAAVSGTFFGLFGDTVSILGEPAPQSSPAAPSPSPGASVAPSPAPAVSPAPAASPK